MGKITHNAVMVHAGPSVDDAAAADTYIGIDDGPGHHYRALTNLNTAADGSGGMNQRCQTIGQLALDSLADARITYGNNKTAAIGDSKYIGRSTHNGQTGTFG